MKLGFMCTNTARLCFVPRSLLRSGSQFSGIFFIYIDESGDLGMDCKECTHFVLSAVLIRDPVIDQAYQRIPKRIRQKRLKRSMKETAELKFSNSSETLRDMFLKSASALDIRIYSLIIDKRCTKESLQHNLPYLYNYLIKILLESVIRDTSKNSSLDIILDRSMCKSQRINFEGYLKMMFLELFESTSVKIVHESSMLNRGLQVTDYISGAFGHKYNHSSERYTDILRSRTIIERNDFFKKK